MGCYHITPTDKGWELRKEGATRPSKTAAERERLLEAIEAFMEKRAGTVLIHSEDGTVEQELSYPRPVVRPAPEPAPCLGTPGQGASVWPAATC